VADQAAILTSGGDSPGTNAAVWAVTQHLERAGWSVLGVRDGFAGLLRGDLFPLETSAVLRHARRGGTFLGTSRVAEFGAHLEAAAQQLEARVVNALIVLGGNGSLQGAAALERIGVQVVGLPATIDNDVNGSDDSIGFDSAVTLGLHLLDGLRDTLESLPRLAALETLGGDTGFLAQRIGTLGGADALLLPEHPLEPDVLETQVRAATERQGFAVVVASEGYPNLEGTLLDLERRVMQRLRFSRPSHAMRGGNPSAHDRALAWTLGTAAARTVLEGQSGFIAARGARAVKLGFSAATGRKPLEPTL
jgi:6-phosphofructokinase 1